MNVTEQVAFLKILTFIAGALLFVGISSFVGSLLRPQRPNKEKLSTYESGEESVGGAWRRFNARFYVIAITFMLFEIEMVLLFPWATVWAHPNFHQITKGLWTNYTAISAIIFIILLAVGLAYVWSQGHLANAQPPRPSAASVSKVPKKLYEQINSHYASLRHKDTASST